MPIEPRHGMRVPSGARLAKVLARCLAAMRRHAGRQLAAGRAPDLAAFEAVVADAVRPLVAHEYALGAEQVRRRLRKRFARPAPAATARKAMFGAPPPDPALALGTAWDVFRPEVTGAAQRLAVQLAGSVTAAAQQAVRDEVNAGLVGGRAAADIADALRSHFSADRAWTIALTESSRAMHRGQLDAARASGAVSGLRWLASSDACPKCLALDGKEVPLGVPFAVTPKGGAYSRCEHPPLHPHCYCSVTEVLSTAPARTPPAATPLFAPAPATAVARLPARLDPRAAPADYPAVASFGVAVAPQDAVEVDIILGDRSPDQIAAMASAAPGSAVAVSYSAGTVTTSVSGGGVNALRDFTRDRAGRLIVKNELLEIDPAGPMKGRGIELFVRQVQELRAAGAAEMRTHAAGSARGSIFNGYYTWARFGYDGPVPKAALAKLKRQRPDLYDAMPKPRRVGGLMNLPGGPEWWKTNGSGWVGVFDLADGSPSMLRLERYVRERLAKEQAGDTPRASKAVAQGPPPRRDADALGRYRELLDRLAGQAVQDEADLAELGRLARRHGFGDEIGE